MKNTYKWRASNIKYIYITDSNGEGPFIYNKQTGLKTFSTHTSSSNVDETLIKNYVSKLSVEDYIKFFNQMIILCQTDNDCAKIKFADVSYYYNTDGDECAETPPPVPCECYTPIWDVQSIRVAYDYDGPYSKIENVEVISATKEIKYYLTIYVPEGRPGTTSGPGPMGPMGPSGLNGENAKIVYVGVSTTTGETASVEVTTGGTPTELKLYFNYVLQKGDKGDVGEQGLAGNDGIDSYIRSADVVSVETLEPYEDASATASAVTFYEETSNKNITDLQFTFAIPRGEQGIQGPIGKPAKFYEATASVVEVLPPGSEPSVEVDLYGPTPIPLTDVDGNPVLDADGQPVIEDQYAIHFKFYLPMGEKGDKGEAGPKGDKGDTDFIYVDSSGGTSPGGGDMFGGYYQFGNVYTTPSYYDPTAPDAIGGFTVKLAADGSYFIELILDESKLGGKYCPGSGITFTQVDDEDCVHINANTEATTVEDIICTSFAPVEALGIWDNDIIPSGTTIQEIFEKIFAKEVFPSSPIIPSISLSGQVNLGLQVIGTTVTLPEINMTETNGQYRAVYSRPQQPSPVAGVTWSNEEILVNAVGFNNHGLNNITGKKVQQSTTAVVQLGTNTMTYNGSADYTKPDIVSGNVPLTNMKHETLSTNSVNMDITTLDWNNASIWDDGTSLARVSTTATGVYPIFTNISSDGSTLLSTVATQFSTLTAGSVVVINNVPSEVVSRKHFSFDFPSDRTVDFKIKDLEGKFVPFAAKYTANDIVQHVVNGVTYNYKRLYTGENHTTTGDPHTEMLQGVSTYQLTFSKSLNS